MSKTCNNLYAKLASEGINILSGTYHPNSCNGHIEYFFEYSWRDPEQDGKLHWSKASFLATMVDWEDKLIEKVNEARRRLERGE